MRFKPVPRAPADLEHVETVQSAIPLVPGGEDDCCARIVRRTEIGARDEARTWLTFLRALELAREGPSGYSRVRREPTPDDLRERFRENVYGVPAILEILEAADEPLPASAVYERFADRVPQYERNKHGERVDEVWSERIERLLEWAVLLELAERTEEGYARTRLP